MPATLFFNFWRFTVQSSVAPELADWHARVEFSTRIGATAAGKLIALSLRIAF